MKWNVDKKSRRQSKSFDIGWVHVIVAFLDHASLDWDWTSASSHRYGRTTLKSFTTTRQRERNPTDRVTNVLEYLRSLQSYISSLSSSPTSLIPLSSLCPPIQRPTILTCDSQPQREEFDSYLTAIFEATWRNLEYILGLGGPSTSNLSGQQTHNTRCPECGVGLGGRVPRRGKTHQRMLFLD